MCGPPSRAKACSKPPVQLSLVSGCYITGCTGFSYLLTPLLVSCYKKGNKFVGKGYLNNWNLKHKQHSNTEAISIATYFVAEMTISNTVRSFIAMEKLASVSDISISRWAAFHSILSHRLFEGTMGLDRNLQLLYWSRQCSIVQTYSIHSNLPRNCLIISFWYATLRSRRSMTSQSAKLSSKLSNHERVEHTRLGIQWRVPRIRSPSIVSLCPYPLMSMMSLKFPELTLDLYVSIHLFKFVQILLGAFCFSTALNSCESRSMIWAWQVENIQRLSKASRFHFSSTSILDFHVNEEQKLQNTRLACLNVG